MKKISGLFLFLSLLFPGIPATAGSESLEFSGRTMGTTYRVKAFAESGTKVSGLDTRIRERLDAINRSMSTYLPESEINRFNILKTAGKPFPVSEEFQKVLQAAQEVYRLTGGAWDGTVKPLVDLWGFGPPGARNAPPDPEKIREALKKVGFHRIRISGNGYLVKENASVSLDLASIAKGYGVDSLAALLQANGIRRFLVEIGGEVFAAGLKPDGSRWRIGINEPTPGTPLDRVYKVLALKDMALATSGDYRNFFEHGGIRYAHVIDPRTGYPVSNGVVSVSVLAKTCMLADALATALMVMGPEKGMELVERLESVQCLILVQNKETPLKEFFSNGFYKTASD